ncbi:MAG: GAP family protein [Pseudohongiellaceae bacterium]
MTTELLLSLTALALIDSTSIGTLLIPIWLLLDHRGVRTSRLITYLLTIAAFYLVVGLVIMLGADLLIGMDNGGPVSVDDTAPRSLTSLVILIVQLAIGIWLFAISFRFDSKRPGAGERIARWKQKSENAGTSFRFLMGLALFAAMAEVATMLPYLGAIAMISNAELTWPVRFWLMIAYCLMMILPAMALLSLRQLMDEKVRPTLARIDNWVGKNAETALGWVLGIAGFLIARDAIARLWMVWFA